MCVEGWETEKFGDGGKSVWGEKVRTWWDDKEQKRTCLERKNRERERNSSSSGSQTICKTIFQLLSIPLLLYYFFICFFIDFAFVSFTLIFDKI